MDFRECESDFREADRRYAELARQRDTGTVGDEELDAKRQQLMVQDAEGRWWAKLGEPGEWHYREGSAWVRGTPPGYQEGSPELATERSTAQDSSPHEGAQNGKAGRRQGVPLWIPVAGLGGIALVGLVLIVWVLVPNLRGEPVLSTQGEPTPGATADAVFVHRATPENIVENSTYLDNSLINADPDAILHVTQNWNPGGAEGTYNEHAVGVWYNPSRQRWAIFNQDREAMPDGAAFNVAVLGGPTRAR